MKYGISKTQETDSDTVAHIRCSQGAWRRKSLCGAWTTPVSSLSGWNLCQKCEAEISKAIDEYMAIYGMLTQLYRAQREYTCSSCWKPIHRDEDYYRRVTTATMNPAGRDILRYHDECRPGAGR